MKITLLNVSGVLIVIVPGMKAASLSDGPVRADASNDAFATNVARKRSERINRNRLLP
jgi:hypothetical protein